MREPTPGFENVSISTTSAPDGTDDAGFDTLAPDETVPPEETFPPVEATDFVSAPWAEGDAIDSRYTCEGLNVAPALSWTAAPLGTAEIAITFEDLDAPTFVHWIIAGISPDAVSIDEGSVPIGAYEATNGLGDLGYTGPCPPAGAEHLYLITVHYLGVPTGLLDGVPGDELFASIATAEVATAEVTGTFSRAGG
ncbi:MAG: YbhB/YbcL family Raf kinase inhibitor-like protein [Actinomycetia bacterium]|nr:YbhB/YbcL family Raf kinase inhibitor-like protein [Actinomycetes bacterium]